MKTSGVYSISSKHNGKVYIGSAINIGGRWIEHRTHLRQNKHHNKHLQNHFNKYGEEDLIYSILEVVDDVKLLVEREQYYINSIENKFNILKTAYSTIGYKFPNAKYYMPVGKQFSIHYRAIGRPIVFTVKTEKEAIEIVECFKCMEDSDIALFYNLRLLKKNNKLIYKSGGKYQIKFRFVNGKELKLSKKYLTLEEAQVYLSQLLTTTLINKLNTCHTL